LWGKEGVTGWSFTSGPYDSSLALNPGVWYGTDWGSSPYQWIDGSTGKSTSNPYIHSRYVFFEGFVDFGAAMEIKPLDILGVNIAIPFISKTGEDAYKLFGATIVQLDLNLPFGNIALSYNGGDLARTNERVGANGAFYAYYGGSFGDIGLDVGLSYHITGDNEVKQPFGVGVGLKYAAGAFGINFKATVAIPLESDGMGDEANTYVNVAVLPSYAINDNLTVFFQAGLGMILPSKDLKDYSSDVKGAYVGWFINPYLRVGAGWGPSFGFGVKVYSDGLPYQTGSDSVLDFNGKAVVKFEIPVAIMVSF